MRRKWRIVGAIAIVLVIGGFVFRAWMRVPLIADRPEFARVAASDTRTTPPVEVTSIVLGRSSKPLCGMAGEASCFRLADVTQAAFLVQHPKGTFLVDAGISGRLDDDLAHMPWLMRKLIGVKIPAGIGERLRQLGVKVDFVLPTHAHWDHTSGIADLPGVEVRMTPEDLAFLRTSTEPGVMKWHLDGARVDTYRFDGPAYESFAASHDLFGDGAVVIVPMGGHTPGAVGVFVNNVRGRRVLFVGDAVWVRAGLTIPSHKSRVMIGVENDRDAAAQVIWRLHHLQAQHPELLIVPTHDGEAIAELERTR